LDLGDPLLDEGRVGSGFEGGAVAVELALTCSDLFSGGGDALLVDVVVLGVGQGTKCLMQVRRCEGSGDPGVDEVDDVCAARKPRSAYAAW